MSDENVLVPPSPEAAAGAWETRVTAQPQACEIGCDVECVRSAPQQHGVTAEQAAALPDDLKSGLTQILPVDSAARKAVPVCTGVIDYFPAVIEELCWMCNQEWVKQTTDDRDDILVCLANWQKLHHPDQMGNGALVWTALDLLERELGGALLTERSVVARWPRALAAVAEISRMGNEKHNPGQPLHHARGKSMDHADCIARHVLQLGGFDGKMRHTACMAWRCMALRQEQLEAAGAPLARGAVLP